MATTTIMKEAFEHKIYQALEKLEAGEKAYLKIVYEAFALENREMVKRAGHAIAVYLQDKTTKYMITLSERFREYSSLEWCIDWKRIDIREKKTWFATEKDYVYALVVGSFHPNGYFREICSKELYHYPNTLGFMLLRTNDWVKPIREEMFLLVLKKIENCSVSELLFSVQHLEKLHRSERIGYADIDVLSSQFYDRLERILPDIPFDKIRFFEFDTRKIIYRLLMKKKVLDFPQINYLMEHEKHSFCKQILVTGTLQYYDCTAEQIEIYLKNKSSIVRRKAMEYKYSIIKDYWDGLEMMLLDESRGVREQAVYILRHHSDICILDFYIEHLQDENPLNAIVGIGENGGAEEGRLILPFLKSSVNKIVCATLRALAKIIETDGYEIYFQYLVSKEAAVSKAAYYAIRYNTIHYGSEKLYQLCIQYECPHIKKYALLLLLRENSWSRLPFLLDLYRREDFKEHRILILQGITKRDMYGRISKQQEERINRILKEMEDVLPVSLPKAIRFDMKFLVEYI